MLYEEQRLRTKTVLSSNSIYSRLSSCSYTEYGSRQGFQAARSYSSKISDLLCIGISTFAVAILAVLIWTIPSPIDPISFRYHAEPCPEFSGATKINNHLEQGQRLFENKIAGPEGFAIDSNGHIYTGLSDGRIIRLNEDLSSFETIVRTGSQPFDECGTLEGETFCGRPLGMHFHPNNSDDLYVADSSVGLIKVDIKSRDVKILVPVNSTLGGRRILNFPNDLLVLANGSVFYTDSSRKFRRDQNRLEFFESRGHGELLYYNPDGAYGVLKSGLFFPNGICLTHDENAILIAETTRARILRYYLDGPRAGMTDVFADNLPGTPDNISPSSSGGYWIGFALVRNSLTDLFTDKLSFMRGVIAKLGLIPILESIVPKHGLVLELDGSGFIRRSLHDPDGITTHATSHILDLQDRLLIGSYFAPFLVEVKL